jgi:uncharacterized protein (DUF1778 family)
MDIFICEIIECKMKEIILKINQTYSILEADKLHSELRILDWILYQVCSNETKSLKEHNNKLITRHEGLNSVVERLNNTMRDKEKMTRCMNTEQSAQKIIEAMKNHYNYIREHSK